MNSNSRHVRHRIEPRHHDVALGLVHAHGHVEAALDNGNPEELADETGDLLFALVNLARHIGADPESALRGTNAKFERRFSYIERALEAKGRSLEDATLEEMDALWNEAKGSQPAATIRAEGTR